MGYFYNAPRKPEKKTKPSPGVRRRFDDGTVEYVHSNGAIGRVPVFSCIECGKEQLISPLIPPTFLLGLRKLCWSCFDEENAVRSDAIREEREARAELMRGYTHSYVAGEPIPPRMKRRVAFALACVEWRDREKIIEIYKECAKISEETGIPHHVDHIYPLQSSYGCGLHVHYNLQIITGADNCSKSNKFPKYDSPALIK